MVTPPAMTTSLNQAEQRQLIQGIQLVKQRLGKQLAHETGLPTSSLMRQMHRQLELLNEHAQCAGNFDCRSQCSSCCYQVKQVSQVELSYIAEQLMANHPQQIPAWRAKLATNLAQKERRCPFLSTQQQCEIYALRPAVCRKAHSYSAAACQTEGQDIPQHLGLLLQAEALILGTQLAVQDHRGASSNLTVDFIQGMHDSLQA